MSKHVNNTYYSDPRGVAIAGKYLEGGAEDDSTPHSAIYGGFNVLTASQAQANAIIAAWDELASAFDSKVTEILGRIPTPPPEIPSPEEM